MKIERFNEGFFDRLKKEADEERSKNFDLFPFPTQKKFNAGAEKYLSQFKKDFNDRTNAENILVEGLFKLEYVALRSQNLESARFLGAMEAVLLLEEVLKPGDKFDYKTSERKFLFIPYTTKESYREHIIRVAKEYLQSKGVL